MVTVCDVQFRNNSKIYYFAPGDLEITSGTDVIIETSRGLEYGQCVRGNHTLPIYETVSPLRNVIRIATPQDTAIDANNREREKKAHQLCLKKIEELGLDMQLVSTECAFDGSKILFFFTADERVDFRELVKMLGYALHSRIELRQIGVRDKAKMVGGLGICGRPFCCGQFLKDFQPVSIKMAKTQNLSLNPTKISGTCGRLMCCLNYEQVAYEDLHRTSPKAESFVDTPDGRGTIVDVNLLKQSVRVRLEKQPDTIVCHKNCDICVLRSGKAKKTDEPIPDDLAPISGNKQNKPVEKPAFSSYLDPNYQSKNRNHSGNGQEDQSDAEDTKARRRVKAQKLGDA
ncbi:MAG: stage 0 sporulation family protein, partial [Oscillospiraceae bacterium]|nr:stage 0 sporulation family protein [Oscillospiraceae bacterium]